MMTATKNKLEINDLTGLSSQEATSRLQQEGYNELPSAKKRNLLEIAWQVAQEPMLLLLVAAGVIYLLLGDLQEALILLFWVFVVIGIGFYQEHKTERALEALRDLSSPRALVIRDGQQLRIAGREVVRGDLVVLAEGDRIPADAVVLSCLNLSVDESLLTGEAVPVRKIAGEAEDEMTRPGGDDLPFVFSGTLVVQGQGIALVRATGLNTEIGKIGKALQTLQPEATLLQKETGRIVRTVAILALALCALVVVVYGLTRNNWLDGFLAGIAMAMALLPEEFPVVLTIFLALGAWRMSQKQVLTRRVPAIETLGAATVLCVDKTGTLTMNRMTVGQLFANGQFYTVQPQDGADLPENFHTVVEFGILASQNDPFDPMEKAIRQLGDRFLFQTEHLHNDWTLLYEYPLSKQLLAMSHVWQSPDERDYVIAAKGAPEAIADLCHLNEAQNEALAGEIRQMAADGLRVLGVARAYFRPVNLPEQQHDFDFEFLGLIGLSDPVRPTVPAAVKECYTAGMRVVMITGDYPGTAQNIARQIGLKASEKFITGPELDALSDAELKERIKTVNIFARVVPEQKLRLVEALKANGEVVAMTGDGVNDAPALKSAYIGIAMGGRGTDVAREAADLVLLDDDFSTIVQAVKMGRRIFDNLRKAMAYILAIHIPIAGISLIPVLFQWPLVLLPLHIVFLEFIIDPACSIVFEAEQHEADIMARPPRDTKEALFSGPTLTISILQGLGVLAVVTLAYWLALVSDQGENRARALAFTTLIIANLGLILINRSWSRTVLATLRSPNKALWWVVIGAAGFLALSLYLPFLQDLFQFAPLSLTEALICVGAALLSLAWFEGLKLVKARKGKM